MLAISRKDNGIWGLRLKDGAYIHTGRFWKSAQNMAFNMFHITIVAKFHSLSGDILSGGLNPDAMRMTLDGGHFTVTSGANPRNMTLLYSGIGAPMRPPLGQICHVTFAWYGTGRMYFHINGLLAGEAALSGYGSRTTPVGAGPLHIGKNCDMTIYQVRIMAESSPIAHGNNGSPWHPERHGLQFENYLTFISPGFGRPNLFYDFTAGEAEGGLIIPDWGEGWSGGGAGSYIRHPGRICHTSQGTTGNGFSRLPLATAPTWEYEHDHPFYFDRRLPTKTYRNLSPVSPPPGALAYDSFQREDVNHVHHNKLQLRMGYSESGSLGPLPWEVVETGNLNGTNYDALGFAIQDGSLVAASPQFGTQAVLDVSTANVDLTNEGTASDVAASITFRLLDKNNHWVCTKYFDGTNWRFETGHITAGTYTAITSTVRVPTTTILRVVANGTSIQCYDDTTLVHSITNSTHQSNTKHGVRQFVSDSLDKYNIWYGKIKSFLVKAP